MASETIALDSVAVDSSTDASGGQYYGRGLPALENARRLSGTASQAHIIDVFSNISHRSTFSKASELRPKLEQRIDPETKCRLVVLSYGIPSWANYELIAIIGAHFGIDPQFFERNLAFGRGSFLRPYYPKPCVEPDMHLPSKTVVSFELRASQSFQKFDIFGYGDALSTMLLTSDNSSYTGESPIVLICFRNGAPRHEVQELWFETLDDLDGNAISSALSNPIEFVLLLGNIMASEMGRAFERLENTYESARSALPTSQGFVQPRDYPEIMQYTQVLSKDIRFALRSIKRLQECKLKQSLKEDFEYLSQRAQELHDSLTDQVAILSLEASRQSIAESKRVNRFTLAAWVFIPVSLIASVFGMNVVELSPGPPISLFFEIVGPVVVVALVLEWWFVQSSEKQQRWKRVLRRNVDELKVPE